MPAILDNLFHKVVNTTSSPIGVEGGEWWGATKWWDLLIQNFLWPNGFNSGCFQLHMSQNVATSMPSPTSQSCSDSLLVVCLAGKVRVVYRPPKHPWMPDMPTNEASVKVDR